LHIFAQFFLISVLPVQLCSCGKKCGTKFSKGFGCLWCLRAWRYDIGANVSILATKTHLWAVWHGKAGARNVLPIALKIALNRLQQLRVLQHFSSTLLFAEAPSASVNSLAIRSSGPAKVAKELCHVFLKRALNCSFP
jgi:hypothetical protein